MLKILAAVVALALFAIWVTSFVVDARRTVPSKPEITNWWPEAEPRYLSVMGVETRYLTAGSGPDLVLLHTFSTELGQFRKVAEELSKSYRVWALDLPGFGYSDLPDAELTAQYYVDFVSAFMESEELDDVVVAGESIGGTIPIAMSAQGDARVTRILALDPIGAHPSPLARSSRTGAVFTFFMRTPVLSGFIQRIRNPRSTRSVYAGAMFDIKNMPDSYFADLMAINQRPEFPRAQKNFIDNVSSWGELLDSFDQVSAPVHIMWGESGWSTPEERTRFARGIPSVTSSVVENAGHFITLDRPDAILEHLTE